MFTNLENLNKAAIEITILDKAFSAGKARALAGRDILTDVKKIAGALRVPVTQVTKQVIDYYVSGYTSV